MASPTKLKFSFCLFPSKVKVPFFEILPLLPWVASGASANNLFLITKFVKQPGTKAAV